MTTPKTETWFCWREYLLVEGEDEPRLLVPWSDPHMYEDSADGIFETPELAREWKREVAEDEDWCLCKMTIKPMEES